MAVDINAFQSKYENLQPGSMTHEIILDIAANVDFHSKASETFQWFAGNAKFFNFQTHDNITLQAYHIESNPSTRNGDIMLYFTGYTETTIKYTHYLKDIHDVGYEIFSFDLRGQGFSGLTQGGYNDGSVTYISSITDSYVKDLDQFLNEYVFPVKTRNNQKMNDSNQNNNDNNNNNSIDKTRIIYSGNSLSGMIGLAYHLQNPHVFSKMILFTPCIKPSISLPIEYVIKSIGHIGHYTRTDSNILAIRFDKNMDKDLLSHDVVNLKLWSTLRDMFPRYLTIAGPSFRFLYEVLLTSDYLLKMAKNVTIDLLIFQADQDTFVDNASMNTFFTSISSSYSKMIRYTSAYHELLVETDTIYHSLISQVNDFLNMTTTTTNNSHDNKNHHDGNGADTIYDAVRIQTKVILNSAAGQTINDDTKSNTITSSSSNDDDDHDDAKEL